MEQGLTFLTFFIAFFLIWDTLHSDAYLLLIPSVFMEAKAIGEDWRSRAGLGLDHVYQH